MKTLHSFVLFLLFFTHYEIKAQTLDPLFEKYWEERSALFPLDATQQGDNRFNHLLPNDQTAEFRRNLKSFYQKYLIELKKIDPSKLSKNDKLSADVFEYELKNQIEGLGYVGWMIPFQQFWGLPLTMGQLGSGESYQPFETVQDYRNWLGRVDGFTRWVDSAIQNFRLGLKKGVVLPKVLVEKMIPQMEKLVSTSVEESLFWGPIKKLPAKFSEEEKTELRALYTKAILTQVNPSYQKLATFLKKEYLPRARKSHGIGAIKGGKNYYRYLVKTWTTTNKSPEEIYAMGLSEVKRIRQEMEKVKEAVGNTGSLQDFFGHLKTSPKLTPYSRPEEIIEAFKMIQAKITPNLPKMFGRTPKTPFEIRQTEEFRAATASAEYNPGSPDGSRPGIFYIPIVDAKKFNVTSGMESLFLHEAIPGHHFQISLQQENEKLPKFRRFSWYGAYGEGWALYTESLGRDLGLYTDPYQYMGALGDEMHRAIRLVVDVGIHLKGMTREEAIKYMMDNEQISEEGAVAEIERYMAIPGQALSYKVGSLEIWELRKKYEAQLGGKFSLPSFHDEFLVDGCLPLAVVKEKLETWSKAQTTL